MVLATAHSLQLFKIQTYKQLFKNSAKKYQRLQNKKPENVMTNVGSIK